jgi:hypothetical protein
MKERILAREIVTNVSVVPRRTHKIPLTSEQRKLYKNKEWEQIILPNNEIGCYHNVWENIIFAEVSIKNTDDYDEITERLNKTLHEVDRKNNCFFRKYKENLALEGAEKLQKREWELNEHKKDRGLIKFWISIAIATIIIDIIIRLFFPNGCS